MTRTCWVMFVMVLSLGGCGGPSAAERDNRRLLDAILTAVSIRSKKELLQDEKLLEQRYADGQLSEESYEAIKQTLAKARANEWRQAEDDLYRFRKTEPFPE
jgi:hypothetical protein